MSLRSAAPGGMLARKASSPAPSFLDGSFRSLGRASPSRIGAKTAARPASLSPRSRGPVAASRGRSTSLQSRSDRKDFSVQRGAPRAVTPIAAAALDTGLSAFPRSLSPGLARGLQSRWLQPSTSTGSSAFPRSLSPQQSSSLRAWSSSRASPSAAATSSRSKSPLEATSAQNAQKPGLELMLELAAAGPGGGRWDQFQRLLKETKRDMRDLRSKETTYAFRLDKQQKQDRITQENRNTNEIRNDRQEQAQMLKQYAEEKGKDAKAQELRDRKRRQEHVRDVANQSKANDLAHNKDELRKAMENSRQQEGLANQNKAEDRRHAALRHDKHRFLNQARLRQKSEDLQRDEGDRLHDQRLNMALIVSELTQEQNEINQRIGALLVASVPKPIGMPGRSLSRSIASRQRTPSPMRASEQARKPSATEGRASSPMRSLSARRSANRLER